MSDLTMSESIFVAASPDEVYAMVSDVTRMGDWSPICRACRWDEGDGPHVGAWFTGRNETPERTWETRSQVVAEPENGGTRLTETWRFLPKGIEGFRERFGDEADAEIDKRRNAARTGIPTTLAAIKKATETG